MNNKEYQKNELIRFLNQKDCYFDTINEFSDQLENMDIPEQIEWIENGSYGSGACFALQNTLNHITPRCNATVRIGKIVLHAFYGCPFRYWSKLSPKAQKKMTGAVEKWMKQKHTFAQELEF